MSILDDMRAALNAADRSKRVSWALSLPALHAVHADAEREENRSATCDGSILGYPYCVTSSLDGWELIQSKPTHRSVG